MEGQHSGKVDAGVFADLGDVAVEQIKDLQISRHGFWVIANEGGESVHEGGEDGAKVDAALEVGDALQHYFERFHVELVGENLERV